VLAIVNYVNLATARAGLRAREVAIRKVVGGTRRALIGQFLFEALATVAVAALIGFALGEIALPFVNTLGGTQLALHYFGRDGIV
ncbi:ABC transporter permease, partial [Escherichia coli]|uniref:ABC transporter permease n=1 Tax=Escherichia coli TaxID=562 RepID=UPI003D36C556